MTNSANRELAGKHCEEPLISLLQRIEFELRRTAQSLDNFIIPIEEQALGEAVVRERNLLFAFQGLDMERQRLNGLADSLGAVISSAPRNWRIDSNIVADIVTLAELSNRLRARATMPDDDPPVSGECDLF